MSLKSLDWIALILLILGGIDLGIIGIFNYDLIIGLWGNAIIIAQMIFVFMGIAAIYAIFRLQYLLRLLNSIP